MPCPCGSPLPYDDCCGRYISGAEDAPTAEALMRSRYTAHGRLEAAYLRRTQHPEDRELFDLEGMRRWAAESRWQGLKVLAIRGGGTDDQEGTVEFYALYSTLGELRQHRETSSFRRVDGRWRYTGSLAGRQADPAPPARVGRNQPCPCGSGKKYKRCCAKNP